MPDRRASLRPDGTQSSVTTKKNFILLSFRYAVAAAILYYFYYSFSAIPPKKVTAIVSSAQKPALMAAAALLILTYFFDGYRLRCVAAEQGISLRTTQAVEINTVAVFYGMFLPGGGLGSAAIRIHRLFRASRKTIEAFTSVAVDRVASIASLCLVGLGFWLAHSPLGSGYLAMAMLAIVTASTAALICLSWGCRVRVIRERPFYGSASSPIAKLIETLKRCHRISPASLSRILALALGTQLLGSVMYYLLAISVGIELSFVTVAWVRAAALIVAILPVSVSGLGLREGTVIVLLQGYGIAGEQTLAFSFLVLAFTVLIIAAAGALLEGSKMLPVRSGSPRPG